MASKVTPPSPDQIRRTAVLCYFDELPDERIARELGVCRRTLARWKRRPDLQAAYGAATDVGPRLIEKQYREQITALARGAPFGSMVSTRLRTGRRR